MTDPSDAVAIHVLEKEYLVSCPEDEREDLLAAARYLDERMKEMRDGGKVLGTERMAVMTALNIVHELLQQRRENKAHRQTFDDGVRRLQDKLDHALGRGGNGRRESLARVD
jgi:cell division protein ZapA